ncbi:thiamine diphosphokinase [Spiroplasma endosymbiont of Panorpa germanica]|uniref:thiamine diphosphokinase n=1 Tax=Spiroplasma endosymbiont of Panorpa germanica TaxID=3066314 RepID=UPI0030D1962F
MKNNEIALVVTCETKLDFKVFQNCYFIGVERGCLDLISKEITIDLAISDFDHVDESELKLIQEKALNTQILNPEKDFIDGEIAIKKARDLGFNKIIYVSNPNLRHDMNLANLYFAFKYNVEILSDKSLIEILNPGENLISFENLQDYAYISFVSDTSTDLSIKGLKYEAKNLKLEPYSLQAISNCFIPYQDGLVINNHKIAMVLTK